MRKLLGAICISVPVACIVGGMVSTVGWGMTAAIWTIACAGSFLMLAGVYLLSD